MKNITTAIITATVTSFAIYTTVSLIKGRECLYIGKRIKELSENPNLNGDELIEFTELCLKVTDVMNNSLHTRYAVMFNKEDRRLLKERKEEVDSFYNKVMS